MKITDVETFVIGRPPGFSQGDEGEFLVTPMHSFPDHYRYTSGPSVGLRGGPAYAVLVRVMTDDGIYGISSVGVGNGAAVYVIEQHLKALVVGEDPFNVELLWEKMFRSSLNYGRKGLVLEAISAIDIALWDIMGKSVELPVYRMLGGATRERIRVYASRLYAHTDLDLLAMRAQAFVEQGYTAIKQRFGYGPRDGLIGMRKNLELIRCVRDAVGPDIEMAADAYMGWDVNYAIRMVRMIEDAGLNLEWVEEPVIPEDIDGYAEIKRSVQTAISGGEHEFTRYGYRELIAKQAVDILQPDVNRVGGITEARKIWAMAAAYNMSVIPHAGQMHNYHLVMSHLNSPIAEYFPSLEEGGAPDDDTLFWQLFQGEPRAEKGFITMPDRPGIGLELNEANVRGWQIR